MEEEKVMAVMEFEDDVCFVVDFKNMRLYEFENPDNVMELKDMKDTGDGYEFYYDPDKKNIAVISQGFVQQETGPYLVQLEYLTKHHAHAMATAHGLSVDIIAGKTDREFLNAIHQKQGNSKNDFSVTKPQLKKPGSRNRLQ